MYFSCYTIVSVFQNLYRAIRILINIYKFLDDAPNWSEILIKKLLIQKGSNGNNTKVLLNVIN